MAVDFKRATGLLPISPSAHRITHILISWLDSLRDKNALRIRQEYDATVVTRKMQPGAELRSPFLLVVGGRWGRQGLEIGMVYEIPDTDTYGPATDLLCHLNDDPTKVVLVHGSSESFIAENLRPTFDPVST
jgi:hypothetical protein